MLLSVGTRLASYEIVAALGAGGMGEVYRAPDTKLGRDVAIKILPELFLTDPDRVALVRRAATAHGGREIASPCLPRGAEISSLGNRGGAAA